MSTLDSHLKELLAEASRELPEVVEKRMFGSDAFFAATNIYGLVWDGRIALRMPDAGKFGELMAMDGASGWAPIPGAKAMKHWVLVAEALHDDFDALAPWVELAHREAMRAPPKKKPRRKTTRALAKRATRR